MRLSITTEAGQLLNVDVDAQMELENLKALIEADINIPVNEQHLFHNGSELSDPKQTLENYNVRQDDVLLLKGSRSSSTETVPTTSEVSSSATMNLSNPDMESMRLMVLGNPDLMAQLRTHQPQLADAVQDPVRWRSVAQGFARWQQEIHRERQNAAMHMDPYDIESQRRIEEAIRMERVIENLETALEHNPEAFGRVTMLYINVEVNGHPVKAFVDSGAQATIMSPDCAERCGIMRLLDKRFESIARGVGTAKILGRVHAAQIKLEDLYLMCSFTILEGKGVELLFGLDLLRRHQMIINLRDNCLTVQNKNIRFLDEHELPPEARMEEMYQGQDIKNEGGKTRNSETGPISSGSSQPNLQFPGTGHILGTASSSSSSSNPRNVAPTSKTETTSRFPETDIQTLIGYGISREEAIQALEAANGDVNMAASFLFGG